MHRTPRRIGCAALVAALCVSTARAESERAQETAPPTEPSWSFGGEIRDPNAFLAEAAERGVVPPSMLLPGIRPVVILPRQGDDLIHAGPKGGIVIIERRSGRDLLSAACGVEEGRHVVLFGPGIAFEDIEAASGRLRHRQTGDAVRLLDDCWEVRFFEAPGRTPREVTTAAEHPDVQAFLDALVSLRDRLRALFTDAPGYGTTELTAAAALNGAADELARGKELVAPWGGGVTVWGLGGAFRVVARDVPAALCEALREGAPMPESPLPECSEKPMLSWVFR